MALFQRTVPDPVVAGAHVLRFDHRSLIMGVLNVTPDSFSDGGLHLDPAAALAAGLRMVEDGADILDVGGESTRPGAPPVPLEEELRRVIPVVTALSRAGLLVSVDTRHAAVAQAAVDAGAGIINDVSAMTHDPHMVEVAARTGAAVVLMHMRGTPQTMQQGPIHYDNVAEEVALYLEDRVAALEASGVKRSQILLDPGMGFGKTAEHNLALNISLERVARGGLAVCWGPSRKSTLGALLGGVPPSERLMGTVASCVMAVDRGAHLVRVHDVGPVRQALAVVDATRGAFIRPA